MSDGDGEIAIGLDAFHEADRQRAVNDKTAYPLFAVDDELKVASRTCMALPITIAYRGHVRGMSPGQTYRFRLIRPAEKKPVEPSPGAPLPAAQSPFPEVKK